MDISNVIHSYNEIITNSYNKHNNKSDKISIIEFIEYEQLIAQGTKEEISNIREKLLNRVIVSLYSNIIESSDYIGDIFVKYFKTSKIYNQYKNYNIYLIINNSTPINPKEVSNNIDSIKGFIIVDSNVNCTNKPNLVLTVLSYIKGYGTYLLGFFLLLCKVLNRSYGMLELYSKPEYIPFEYLRNPYTRDLYYNFPKQPSDILYFLYESAGFKEYPILQIYNKSLYSKFPYVTLAVNIDQITFENINNFVLNRKFISTHIPELCLSKYYKNSLFNSNINKYYNNQSYTKCIKQEINRIKNIIYSKNEYNENVKHSIIEFENSIKNLETTIDYIRPTYDYMSSKQIRRYKKAIVLLNTQKKEFKSLIEDWNDYIIAKEDVLTLIKNVNPYKDVDSNLLSLMNDLKDITFDIDIIKYNIKVANDIIKVLKNDNMKVKQYK